MWYLKNTNFPVPDHWCRDILPWERRQSQGVAVVWIFSLCQGGLLHVLMLLISQGKQRLPATLKISSHLFLSFLLNLVPLFLRLPSKEWRIGSELFFFTYTCKGFFTSPLPPPPAKAQHWNYWPSTFRAGNPSTMGTVRTPRTGFCFCREPVWRKMICSYTAELTPAKLTDVRGVEATSWATWVSFCHCCQHTRQSWGLMPAVPGTALSTPASPTYAVKWWLTWITEVLHSA